MKKIIKLINDERLNASIQSQKADNNADCSEGANDVCYYIDSAGCSTYANDVCNKDYAACIEGAQDICTNYRDIDLCIGAGNYDTN